MTSLRRSLLSFIAVAFMVLAVGEARADCADPYDCVCPDIWVSSDLYAVVVDEVMQDTAQVTVVAVAASEVGIEVGDTFSLAGATGTAAGERWLVYLDGAAGTFRRLIPEGQPFACLQTSFTLQEVLDYSASDNCREQALEAAGSVVAADGGRGVNLAAQSSPDIAVVA